MRTAISIFVAFSILVVLIFVAYAQVLNTSVGSPEDRAAFGEMFGMLGALFSALAFAAVTCSIVIQFQQLKHQRDDAKDTKEQVDRQLRLAADTAGALERSARLNALATIAQGYDREMTSMEKAQKTLSDEYLRATELHRRAITEAEHLYGLPTEERLYYEKPIMDVPEASARTPKPPSGSFTFKGGGSSPSRVDETE